MHNILAVIGNVLAIIIFLIGLISPLTPSSGIPSISSIFIFVVLPLICLVYAWRIYASKISKYIVMTQGLFIIVFVSYLLMIQAGFISGNLFEA